MSDRSSERIENVAKVGELMQEAARLLNQSELPYAMRELGAAYDLLMTRFAPFKVGDRVRLTQVPEITETKNSGWFHVKHFVKVGARGVVSEARCGTRGFRYGVTLDNQSWFDSQGQEYAIKEPYIYPGWREQDLAHE